MSLRLDVATIAKIEADRIYDLILPEMEGKETVTVPSRSSRTCRPRGRSWNVSHRPISRERSIGSRGRRRSTGSGKGRHPEAESRRRRGRVSDRGGVGAGTASMSRATPAPTSPGPAEKPGPRSSDEDRELEGRPDADRDGRDGGDSPVVNETPPRMPVRSEATGWAPRGSSPADILTRGGAPGLIRGGLAFVVMAALGQAVAFAVTLAQATGVSAGTAAKLGWLYFGWFHHAAVTTRLTSVEGGEAVTANVASR